MSNSEIQGVGTRRGAMTRRRALGLAGVAGAAYVAGPLGTFGGGGDAADPQAAEAASSCVLAPEVTEGPYWVDVREKRSDVRAGQSGVPLTLDLYVYRSDDSCEPEAGAVVDIWHCNASGLYSDEAANGTSGQTWLRGYQETDSTGHVRFTTIFPGWYMGRCVHIHLRVRTFSGSSTTYNFTTQLFFDESVAAAVFATSPYSAHGTTPDITNSADGIYQQEVKAGNVLMPSLSGGTSAGYSGTVGIGLSGLPASSSNTAASSSGSGGSSGSGSSTDTAVEASLVSRRFIHAGDRRELVLGLKAGERIAAEANLMRGGRSVAHKRIAALAPGRHNLAVPIGDATPAGAAQLKLTLTDRAGNSRTIRKRVAIPNG